MCVWYTFRQAVVLKFNKQKRTLWAYRHAGDSLNCVLPAGLRSAFSILSHQHKSPQWHRMRPNAHRKHCSVCTVSPVCTLATAWWPTPGRLLCVFPLCNFSISLQSSWLRDIHYIVLYSISGQCVLTSHCLLTLLWCHHSYQNNLGADLAEAHQTQTATCVLHKRRENVTNLLFKYLFNIRVNTWRPCSPAEFPSPDPALSAFCSLAFGTLYPAYSSYKAVKTKNVKEYVSIVSAYSIRADWFWSPGCCQLFVLNASWDKKCKIKPTDN